MLELEKNFSRKSRQRGEDYFNSGLVEVTHGDEASMKTLVSGSDVYNTDFERIGDLIRASCTCPIGSGNLACKHMWAGILLADDRGYLGINDAMPPTRIEVVSHGNTLPKTFTVEVAGKTYTRQVEVDESPRNKNALDINAFSDPVRWLLNKTRGDRDSQTRRIKWQQKLGKPQSDDAEDTPPRNIVAKSRQLVYLVPLDGIEEAESLPLELATVPLSIGIASTDIRQISCYSSEQIATLPDETDRRILSFLAGAKNGDYGYGEREYFGGSVSVGRTLADTVMPIVCSTNRCHATAPHGSSIVTGPLRYDVQAPWRFIAQLAMTPDKLKYMLIGFVERDGAKHPVKDVLAATESGWIVWAESIGRIEFNGAFHIYRALRTHGPIEIPLSDGEEFARHLYDSIGRCAVSLPENLRCEEKLISPSPRLIVKAPKTNAYWQRDLQARLEFSYNDRIVSPKQQSRVIEIKDRQVVARDVSAEKSLASSLFQAGFKKNTYYGDEGFDYCISEKKFPKAVLTLLNNGWHVDAMGKLYRTPGKLSINVTSGVDWFDLEGKCDYNGIEIPLPAILAALRRKEQFLPLGDGSFGMLPTEWLNKYGAVTAAGEVSDGKIRFKRSQAMLIDALLAGQPEATCDETFATVRQELRNFDKVETAEASPEFVGTLRPYQKDGLGWLFFLRRFSFGGCLADDMGLGKTVQVLALLDRRRNERAPGAPRASLVVAPRSIIFNWKQEAARFAPNLKVLDHTGLDRSLDANTLAATDIVLTTYGTLRSDIEILKDHVFDYIVLDESQAIKNAGTATAKAVRLLRGANRLAMSGTPIENHLGELWSLMEFLNPGMLGSATVFKLHAGGRDIDSEVGKLLSRAMRPFILRRTKSQVAKDLPERTEETIWCELQGSQKKLYDELLAHYRATLLDKVRAQGINKSRMNILEALLRLRQAACHPGLLDGTKAAEQGAKLEALIPQIGEVLEENHKALIFSQFTSYLAILRRHLDKQKLVYEYLDGQTQDRQAGVERFQNDPDCKLFLISLKAGGLGLNLTAAEYVYLLDPWWNPAVEAQAIDRAHRIGQTRKVFAYRLIARDTIEEKVLQLQKSKRDLADAIIGSDNSLIGSLTREDLELLLS